jgi:hypothetical protein
MIAYILLLTHALGDFIFQWKSLAKNKVYNPQTKKTFILAHITHIFIHSIIIVAFLFVFNLSYSSKIFWLLLFYLLVHFIIDVTKGVLSYNFHNRKNNLVFFILDQSFHILAILVISILARTSVIDFNFGFLFHITEIESASYANVLMVLFIIIYSVFGGAFFVPLTLDLVYDKFLKKFPDENNDNNNIGYKISELSIEHDINDLAIKNNINNKVCIEKYRYLYMNISVGKPIGMIERLLITIGLLMNSITLIVGIIGIKTWVRHTEFNKRSFSEYYLLGTLVSISFTVMTYGIVRLLFPL